MKTIAPSFLAIVAAALRPPPVCESFSTAPPARRRTKPVRDHVRGARGGRGTARRRGAPPPATILRSKREDAPPRRRRRRNGASGGDDVRPPNDGAGTDVAARALESSVAFLARPRSLPFLADVRVPLAYPAAALAGLAVLPPATWGLSVVLSGAYLALGAAVAGGAPSERWDGGDPRRDEDAASEWEDDDTGEALLPWASLAGGLATAGLLSPQGLGAGGDAGALLAPAGLAAAGLGLATLVAGLDELGAEEEVWEETRREEGAAREERTRLERWDEELEERFER